MTIPQARAGQEPLREARQVPAPAQTRAAEDRGAAMSLATTAGSALMLTAPGPRQPRAPPEPDKLSARERELVARAAPTPRSPPSCTSASAPSARTWTASGTRPATAAAPTPPAYPRPIRQLAVAGLGHDQPTLLITNQAQLPARQVIQSFSLPALAGAVPLNVDLDIALPALASTIYAALRRRLPGYASATPDTLQRRFLNTGGIIEHHRGQTTIRLARRTYSPVPRQASLPDTITCHGGKARPSATNND